MLFFITLLYVALYYIRPFEWMPSMMGKSVFLIVGILSLAILLIVWGRGHIRLFHHKADFMVLGFSLAIILSHLRHGYVGGAMDSIRYFFPSLVGFFLVSHSLNTIKKINFFIFLLIALATFLAYESYLQITSGLAHGGLTPFFQNGAFGDDGVREIITRTRWYGVFNDPNDLGLALVLVVPFLIERFYQRLWILPILTLPVILAGLYWTNSRGAMLSLGAGLFSYFVLRYRSIRGVVTGIVIASLGMLIAPSRMANLSAGESSAYGRIEAWHAGFQMFKSFPIFGVGQGMFTDYHSLTAHNSYMLVLSELGLFGSFFFLGLFILPFQWIWKQFALQSSRTEKKASDYGLSCALMGSLIGILAGMFFLSRAYIMLPFMIIALLSARANLKNSDSEEIIKNTDFVPNINWQLTLFVLFFQIIFINLIVKFFI